MIRAGALKCVSVLFHGRSFELYSIEYINILYRIDKINYHSYNYLEKQKNQEYGAKEKLLCG